DEDICPLTLECNDNEDCIYFDVHKSKTSEEIKKNRYIEYKPDCTQSDYSQYFDVLAVGDQETVLKISWTDVACNRNVLTMEQMHYAKHGPVNVTSGYCMGSETRKINCLEKEPLCNGK
ncbi:hypothetical protein PFISCL1PPCAC_10925, partial [Pristionchus fissidentatus]